MPPLSRVATLALVLALLAGTGIAAGGTTPGHQPMQVEDGDSTPNTTMVIELAADGDARWTVSMTFALEDEADSSSFQSIGADFEAGTSDVLSIETFQRFADLASQATGREMGLTDVEREATVTNETGRLELAFTWEAFGHRQGETLEVSDAFQSPSGTWLEGLTSNQQLVIEAPDSFDITSAPKGFTNKTIRWSGPTTFDPSYLSVTYQIDTETVTTSPTTTPSTTTPPTTTPTPGSSAATGSLPMVVTFLTAIVALGVVGAYTLRRRGVSLEHLGSTSGESDDTTPTGATRDEPASAATATGETVSADVEPEPSGTPGAEDAEAAADQPPIDRELLSDEEYVEALLERNGGRMKQANIVSETGWSNAKVSQLLSGMADEGRVEKLRIGRENLISFPDVDNGIDEEP